MYAMGLEPIEDLLSRLRAGFYSRISLNETTWTIASAIKDQKEPRKNKAATFVSEIDKFIQDETSQQTTLIAIATSSDTQAVMKTIERNLKEKQENELSNIDLEIVSLIGNGEWREREEIILANQKLNEILAAYEQMPKEADRAFIGLEGTFLNDTINT